MRFVPHQQSQPVWRSFGSRRSQKKPRPMHRATYRVSALFSSCKARCSFAPTQVRMFFITFAFRVGAQLRYACPKCSIFLPLGCKHTCMKGESNPAGIASSNRREGSVIHISELAGSSTLHAMPFFLQHQNHFAGPRIKEISLTNSLSLHKIEVWKGHWKTNGP